MVERLGDDRLRLGWTGGDVAPGGVVELFVADSAQRPITSERLYGPPYAAVLARGPRAAFAGVQLRHADGTRATTLLPLRPSPDEVRARR